MPYLQPTITRAGASASDAIPTGTNLYLTSSQTGNVAIDGTLTVSGAIGGASTMDLSGNFTTLGTVRANSGDFIGNRAQLISGVAYNTFTGSSWTGSGTLVAGEATISNVYNTTGSKIFLTRHQSEGTPCGSLSVVSVTNSPTPGSGSFIVRSLDAAGALLTTDVGSFDYFIINALNL